MATFWENSCSFGLRYVSWYKYLIVSLFFSHLGFWSGNLFLIAPFPDLCLRVPFDAPGVPLNIRLASDQYYPLRKLAHAIYTDFFSALKIENFQLIFFLYIFFLFLLKT